MSVAGGSAPYAWQAMGLPDGFSLEVDLDTSLARLVGVPAEAGTFPVQLKVEDADGLVGVEACEIDVQASAAVKLDSEALLEAFPGGCVPFGVAKEELVGLGILPDVGWACALVPGRGNGSADYDDDNVPDEFPPGVVLDEGNCMVSGPLSPALKFGTYAWIVTYTRDDAALHVPYCAAQAVQTPMAYAVSRFDAGDEATLVPGVQVLAAGEAVAYGTAEPDPQVFVGETGCGGGSCCYAFVFTYNALSNDGTIVANPNAKFPDVGFEGFTHAIRVNETGPDLLAQMAGRAWVVNAAFDYCVADNPSDCGNGLNDAAERAAKIRANGGGSTYQFSLVLLPE